jgi:transposase
MYIREKLSIREIARRTNLSRNTVRQWLKSAEMSEPKYPKRHVVSVVDPYVEQLRSWLETDSHRPKRDRRTARIMFEAIKAQGYLGSYVRACVRVRKLRQELGDAPHRSAFVPLSFGHGEAFQFDWSCEYAWIDGLRRRLEVSHCKLACIQAYQCRNHHQPRLCGMAVGIWRRQDDDGITRPPDPSLPHRRSR